MQSKKALIENLMSIGVRGYCLKNSTGVEIIEAIKSVNSGGNAYANEIIIQMSKSHEVNNMINDVLEHEFLLTKREVEILKLISEGYSNTEIGDKIFISPRTVDTHRTNMMKKLDVKNIAGLIKYAFKSGLI